MSSFGRGFIIGGLFAILIGAATAVFAERNTHKMEPCIQPDKPAPSKKV